MKALRKSVFLIFISLSSISYSQNIDFALDSITNNLTYKYAEQILITYSQFFLKQTNIGINVDIVYNANGQKTILSEKLSAYIAQNLNKWLNKNNFIQTKFNVFSPFDKTKLYQKIESTTDFDYTLTGTYILDYNQKQITFAKFKLIPTKNQTLTILALETFSAKTNFLQELTKLDVVDPNSSIFQEFLDFNKENSFIQKADIQTNSKSVTLIDFGSQKAFAANYDLPYNMFLNIRKSVYIYTFFYDPSDVKNPYIWYIEQENKIYEPKAYNNFFSEDFLFFKTSENQSLNYIKIIATTEKIDIDKYLSHKFIDKYEVVVIESTKCKELLNAITKLNEVQTINLILSIQN